MKRAQENIAILARSWSFQIFDKNGYMEFWQTATEITNFIYHSIGNDERKPNMCLDSELISNS